MPSIPRVGDLEIEQDLEYQRREWVFERAGWVLMALLVLAGLSGLLGDGPLSSTSAIAPDGSFRVEYDRFVRRGEQTTLRLHLGEAATRQDEARVWLSQEYLGRTQLRQVTPRPVRVEIGDQSQVFVFRMAERGGQGTVVFHFEPQGAGWRSGEVGLVGQRALSLGQLVYP